MYKQISSNIWKSWGLLFIFLAFVVGVGFIFAYATDNPFIVPLAVIIAIVMTVGSYYNSDKIVLAISKARPAQKPEHAHLINSVEGLAIAAGIPTPRAYVIDDTAPNAFATGRDPQHAVIAVTTGLMQKMNRVELEGVVAHEMSHIKNYDIRFATLVAVMVGIIALLADWM
ncbi:MAG TPA: M48 family metalloprotease, partial [Armatimonadota bacterium]|nr:M48 family metalloprotease [Armatimonadota bacterium]